MSVPDVARRLLPEQLFADCNVVLFEDEQTAEELFPLAVLRPSWEIRCGAGSLRQWVTGLDLPEFSLIFRPREALQAAAPWLAGQEEDPLDPALDTLFLNGRLIALWPQEQGAGPLPGTYVDGEGRLLWARVKSSQAQKLLAFGGNEIARSLVQEAKNPTVLPGWELRYARYVWDFMVYNQEILVRQLTPEARAATEHLGGHTLRELPPGVQATARAAGHPIFIGSQVKLMPGVVLGNHAGPIWIGSQTEVEPHTYLEGPLYIGPHCRVKMGARFYHGVALGPHCRVAGEISESILQGFINKQHDGFLGNSHLGQWVNLGADTRTSNLKNDYSNVRVQVGRRLVETGRQFIGLLMGDHTKTGINTMFNTGTVVGVAANVYGAGYPPRLISSFAWGGISGFEYPPLERTLNTARIAMPRRGQELSEIEVELLRRHYAETVKEKKS